MGDGGLLALQSRPAEAGSKPPQGALAEDLVNMSVGSEAGVFGGGLVDCDAVWEMEVCWPSRVGLRRRALNRREGLWLMTVVLNVVGKGVTRSRQVWTGKMCDGRESSVVDVSKAKIR